MRVFVVTVLVAVATAENYYRLPTPFSYSCRDSLCVKEDRNQAREHISLEKCQLTCGKYGSLWPQPTGDVQLSSETVSFSPRNLKVTKIAVSGQKVANMLDEATRHFTRTLHYLHPDYPEDRKRPYSKEERFLDPNQYGEKYQQFDQQQQNRPSNPGQQRQNTNEKKKVERYLKYSPFQKERSSPGAERHNVNIEITVTSPDDKLTLNTDESYNLVVQTVEDKTTVTILATTYYGARHALETLSQVVSFDENNDSLQMVRDVKIQDEPQFRYRGFMLDTGRNFYSKEDIMHLLDAMSYNKMNYFHWHITDAASFPMYSNRIPEMAYYGSYSPRKVYYPEDIAEIVQYAKHRGINVVPELDGPAHASAGWEWGAKEGKGRLVLCTEKDQPWFNVGKEPPSGQLNPVNPELYPVLGELYRDMLDYFDPEMVHMGGDDVSFKCWQNANEIKEYLAANSREANSREYFELWNTYQSNAFSKLQEAAGQERKITPIIHSSSFARNYVDKNTYVIQVGEEANKTEIADYVNNGFKVIFSNRDQWRLDCASTTWVGDKTKSCARELPTWEHFYQNSPLDMLYNLGLTNARSDSGQQKAGSNNPREFVLGGEATLWSSETDGNGLESKAWPRVAAMAERLWTDPLLPLQGIDTAQKRINTQRQRMVYRGVRADPLQPEFCLHDESACYSKEQYVARSATRSQPSQPTK
ncbi:LOW QUALITY PROTEIN: chitooligosaccharidolytic beta-N-acetylglucosaminidase-like [Panulirus ornatus]|uniref:LOW QUALITY PROTEIN: chitooligosaccharidolytic beta-N-acetylglucosaminidase-like n=1 Tax=Panulirus ornatus TaxID=150431 RepID=UPI003A8C230B